MCQMRHCNNPAPKNGGASCEGPSIAVSNCTVHGGWTTWSAWSECSATCGVAVKTRTRTCTNPYPAYGGRVCVGQDRSEVLCTKNPPCPAKISTSRHGVWGPWDSWEPCSATCGVGYRRRFRTCNNSLNGDCTGSDVEYEKCHLKSCPEISEQMRITQWTPWYRINNTNLNDGYVLRRFKYSCKAPVIDASNIKIGIHKEEDKVCQEGACLPAGHEVGRWTMWSPWSPCSSTCGKGYQTRQRHCETPGQCRGRSTQKKECINSRMCESNWSCWTDWSPCSVTCGWGIRKRFRTCFGELCSGHHHEEEACQAEPCGCEYKPPSK